MTTFYAILVGGTIHGKGGPSTAAVDGPAGPVTAADHIWRDRSREECSYNRYVLITGIYCIYYSYLPGYLNKQTVYQNEKERLFIPDKFIG